MSHLVTDGPRGAVPRGEADLDVEGITRRLASALSRTTTGTRRAYDRALKRFAAYACTALGIPLAPWWTVVCLLAEQGRLVTADIVDGYTTASATGLAPATVAQRLAAVRWAFKLLYEAGTIGWVVSVRAPKITSYRDTRGPDLATVQRLLDAANRMPGIRGQRDGAVVRLMFVLGLRRAEVASLTVADWDSTRGTLSVLGKGRTQRQPIAVALDLRARIDGYLAMRGRLAPEAPLFVTHGPVSTNRPVDGETLRRVLGRLSALAGLDKPVRPHGLRHAAITAALDLFEGDVRRVARFSRHRKLETLMAYDDNRHDLVGEVAQGLEDLIQSDDRKLSKSRGNACKSPFSHLAATRRSAPVGPDAPVIHDLEDASNLPTAEFPVDLQEEEP